MNILAVDDEYLGLEALKDAIKEASPDAEIVAFNSSLDALEFAKKNNIYAAFLDVFMPGMNGIELAKKLKAVNPAIKIVFATGFDDYMKDAFQIHANGYVLKPITPKKIKSELDYLKTIGEEKETNAKSSKRIVIQCFGNFEVFVDGVPVRFKYDKTKEMLAFLVSRRGALCSNGEITVNLWEDDGAHDSYLRGIRKDLLDVFKSYNLEDAFFQQRGKIGINTKVVDCDYYNFIDGDVAAINKYNGEFMNQYSWGELLISELSKL